jgi:hypothetical protein
MDKQLELLFESFRKKASYHKNLAHTLIDKGCPEEALDHLARGGTYIEAAQEVLDIQKGEYESKSA